MEEIELEIANIRSAIRGLGENLAEYERIRGRASACAESKQQRTTGAQLMRDVESKIVEWNAERLEWNSTLAVNKRLLARHKLRTALFEDLMSNVTAGNVD